ncbi:MAG: N-acetylglucosamine-6-phosphate deacetylase [Ruminococcaceae bacterium]|nr:N-acetylglucosamine-6-phosphate deacetylase [Oscillospiraceae bacterium]
MIDLSLLICNAKVYDSEHKEFFDGSVLTEQDRIVCVSREPVPPVPNGATVVDAKGRMLIPGLVDIHTHGRAGGDFNTADDSLMVKMAKSYLSSGVTAVMPTLASATLHELTASVERINTLKCAEGSLPYVIGVHLEGRYLNPAKRGAHAPELLCPLDADELEGILNRIHGAKHISAAFELDTDGSFLRRALELGATVGLGHTAADFTTATRLINSGVTTMTHLFNAMPPLHHRDGGAVAAGLLGGAYCELICDGFHIAPEMVKMAYRLLKDNDRLVLITDSMEATDCADGEYTIAGMPVTVKDGKARTHDGAIAGSTLTLLDGVKNLADFAAISFEDAIYCATLAPARAVGISDELGSIEQGKRADMLLLDKDFRMELIVCGGKKVKF